MLCAALKRGRTGKLRGITSSESSFRRRTLHSVAHAATGAPGAAVGNTVSSQRRPVNAHIHLPPNFSAFDSVRQAVDLAWRQGIRVLGASNYYDYTVYREFASVAEARGVYPLFGIEVLALLPDLAVAGVRINDPGNPGRMYLCGKGITHFQPLTQQAATLLGEIRDRDSRRMAHMTVRMAGIFADAGLDTDLDDAAVRERVVRRHGCPPETVCLQERHVAQAFQELLFEKVAIEARRALLGRVFGVPAPEVDVRDAAAVQNAVRASLMKAGRPAYVEETFVGFAHAYRLVLALGGIPCYPTLADGASPLCAFEEPVERLIGTLQEMGIFCAEFIPNRNSPETLTHYVEAFRNAGMVVTAGTEHNTRELLPLEPACTGGQAIPDGLRDVFWEGACVVAAHQHLVSLGRTGYVDSDGRLNPDYGAVEERIGFFRRLGSALIEAFPARTQPSPSA